MTEEERIATVARLIEMQNTMRSLMEYVEAVADACKETGEQGLAFSIYMIRESLAAYSNQVNKYTTRLLGDD